MIQRNMGSISFAIGILLTIGVVSCNDNMPTGAYAVSDEDDGSNWAHYGRTTKEQHYSPLTQINDKNIDRLGLAWTYDLPVSPSHGSAPLAVDGVLYFSAGHSIIHAMVADTGELLWKYDPEVFKTAGHQHKMRGGWNGGVRGIAYSDGKVLTATLDGRLIALDFATGKLLWSVMTIEDDGLYITGAPWVMKDKVIIGNGGADLAPVRGYVTAYNINTGKQAWRFYTVPGNPEDGFENKAMEMAAKTWSGDWWKLGGGGTVWNAMAYDKELKRIYIGTGNGAPWNQKIRSPKGGDNLFLCSIVALDADTGEYIWHYQVNPGESWDYNAAMDIELAEITIDGRLRSVILHAPKNGFFYVIDRTDGKLISAEKFAPANWAERIDLKTGRPVENPAARYPNGKAALVFPSSNGAHAAESMSYSPKLGLAYIPVWNLGQVYQDPPNVKTWKHRPGMVENTGAGYGQPLPKGMVVPPMESWLSAWDPVKQKEIWRVGLEGEKPGGTMTTAGNLVVQGRATGELGIYTADRGEKIWSFDAQTTIFSQPITYLVGDKQYISVLTGWNKSGYYTSIRRVLTFALDSKRVLPSAHEIEMPIVEDPEFIIDPQKSENGKQVFIDHCILCHGGRAPDLTRSFIPTKLEYLTDILRKGRPRGMPQFNELPTEKIEALQHYIRELSRQKLKIENGHSL